MQQFTEIKGYATQENAIRAARKVIDLDTVRWMMGVTPAGRFHVIVMFDRPELIGLAHRGICITK